MVQLNLELSNTARRRLQRTAKNEGITVAELIRRALNLEAYLRTCGAKIYVTDRALGQLRELKVR